MYFSKKPKLLQGEEGDESSLQNLKSAKCPGYLATTVHCFQCSYLIKTPVIEMLLIFASFSMLVTFMQLHSLFKDKVLIYIRCI